MSSEENEVPDVFLSTDGWKDCIFCQEYERRTQTNRYCNECGAYFCEGTHGKFHPHGGGCCCACLSKRKKFRDRLVASHFPIKSK